MTAKSKHVNEGVLADVESLDKGKYATIIVSVVSDQFKKMMCIVKISQFFLK